jgi:hypothetical protein
VASGSPDASSKAEARSNAVWQGAGESLVVGPVSVRVDQVEFDLVRGKDEANRVLTSKSPFVHVWLQIGNSSDRAVDYHSWYARNGEDQHAAVLIDNVGRSYPPAWFEQLRSVRGHKEVTRILAGEELRDVIVFPLPEDFDPTQHSYLRLQLDATAIGHPGSLRFEIPLSAIHFYYGADGSLPDPTSPVSAAAMQREAAEDDDP